MRIALVTDSFLPDVDSVANSLARSTEHFLAVHAGASRALPRI